MFKKIIPNNKSVRYVLLICISIGISVPLIYLFSIYPSLKKEILIKNTEDSAMHMVTNLSPMFKQGYAELTEDPISPDLIKKIKMFQNNFRFMKVRIFLKNGGMIYSTDPKDIGKAYDNPYFQEIVSKGNTYSKIIKENIILSEGETVTTDIADIYVPIISDNMFVGVFEVYYNITPGSQALDKILLKSSVSPFLMMLGGFILTVIILIQMDISITRQKETEQELKIYTDKLKHSNRELESFAHIASHDLQEPLRKIITFGERLEIKYEDKLGDTGVDYIRRMQSASMRMQTLINDLLTFSRVTSKAKPFIRVNLNAIIKEVLFDLETLVERTGGQVETDNLETVDADPMQMRQLFQNIIGNGLKFYKEGIPPVIRISGKLTNNNRGDSDNAYYQITIKDNGIGFDNKYADRIFGVFQRLHGRKEYSGTGIGLSICQRIIDRHNGKIKAESSSGEGASFLITLPIQQKNGGNNG